jgi:tetratricopeptide (TPR) repeat protein
VTLRPGLARGGTWILGALVTAAAFTLAVTRVEDPDAWTHLALGRLMLETRGLPAHELLVYPSPGLAYHNTEWLFDIVVYLVFRAGGLAGVVLAKAATVALAFWILWKDATLSRGTDARAGLLPHLLAAAVLLCCLPMVRHRFVERPDVALMVFLGFTIYALDAYLLDGRRWIFWLPAVHVLWANLHPSVIVTVVPFGAVLGGGVALHLAGRCGVACPDTPSVTQLRTVAAVLVADLLASLLNPRHVEILTLPFQLATSPWFTQEVTELRRPPFDLYPGPYILAALLLLTCLALWRRAPVIPALLVAPFAFLGFSAVRFVFLLVIVGAPLLSRNLAALVSSWSGERVRRPALAVALAGIVAGTAAVGLALAQVPPLAEPRKSAGLGADDRFVPEGALRYLDRIGMTGRLFNAFHFGGYIAWRDFPKRAAIIDGRGYVPPGLQEEIHFARAYPEHLDRLQSAYGFDAAVMDYPVYSGESLAPDIDLALTSPGWALVYWDDFALVYLRRSSAWAEVIARDQYRKVRPANGLPALWRSLADKAAVPEIRAELERNIAQTGSARGRTFLGFALLQEGKTDAALDAFRSVRDPERRLDVLQGEAIAWQQKGDKARTVEAYERAVAVQEDALTLYGLGAALIEAGRASDAISPLERARAKNPGLLPVYPLLIEACRRAGQPQREAEIAQAGAAAIRRGQAAERARNGLGLNGAGRLAEAVAELEAASALDPDNAKIRSDLGFVYLFAGRREDAIRQQRAALERDPRLAQAHYGLAQALEKGGDGPGAKREFAEYARLEPRSYLAWRLRGTPPALPR